MHDHYLYLCRLVRHRLGVLATAVENELLTHESIADRLRATAQLMEVADYGQTTAPHGTDLEAVQAEGLGSSDRDPAVDHWYNE